MARYASRDPQTGCVVWQRSRRRDGYGQLNVAGRPMLAHRIAYELARGRIAPGLQVDHVCRNRSCCNPDHLEAVTQLVNIQRGSRPSRTHCRLAWHPYDKANTGRAKDGARVCRACARDKQRRLSRKAKERRRMNETIAELERELRLAEAWRDDLYAQLAVSEHEIECKRAALFIARAKLAETQEAA